MKLCYNDIESIQEQIIDQYEVDKKYYDIVKIDSKGNHHVFEVDIREYLLQKEIDELKKLHTEDMFISVKERIINNEMLWRIYERIIKVELGRA